MAYTSFPSALAEVTGTGITAATSDISGGWITNVALQWQSSLQKVQTVDGNLTIPNIVRGQAQVTVLVPPDGMDGPSVLSDPEPQSLCINGATYANTYYTGGALGIRDFGEGRKALELTKVFTIFGECATA
jgi:hypothetical protein